MTWTQLGDELIANLYVRGASERAFVAYVEVLAYGNRHLTDGEFPRRALPLLVYSREDAEERLKLLVELGLLDETADGWQVVGWDEEAGQELAVDVEHRKKRKATNSRRWRQHRQGVHDLCLDDSPCRRTGSRRPVT